MKLRGSSRKMLPVDFVEQGGPLSLHIYHTVHVQCVVTLSFRKAASTQSFRRPYEPCIHLNQLFVIAFLRMLTTSKTKSKHRLTSDTSAKTRYMSQVKVLSTLTVLFEQSSHHTSHAISRRKHLEKASCNLSLADI